MKLLDVITIKQPRKTASLQILQGDLSNIPLEHKVDILVLSAFPNDYKTLPGSLMLALQEKGLSVRDLAEDKAADLRTALGCWLSHPIPAPLQEALNFRRILCFEPGTHSNDPLEVVSHIFRCLNNFVFEDTNNSIAMPVIASGYQKVPFEKMLPVLVQTSLFWLKEGLPVDCIKIVVLKEEQVELAKRIFNTERLRFNNGRRELLEEKNLPTHTPQPFTKNDEISKPVTGFKKILQGIVSLFKPAPINKTPVNTVPAATALPASGNLDYFISYAHTESKQVQHFVDALLEGNPRLQIFYDKTSIPSGGLWLRHISDAITQARSVIVFMSPDYSASMVCWDEFQCAKLKEYNTRAPVIQTIYLNNDPALPPIMGIHSYIDCREGDLMKLATACRQLLSAQ